MNALTTKKIQLPAMGANSIEKVYELESLAMALPQAEIATHHALHAGMYARTIMIPAGVILTGALIKIDTILIVSGHVHIFTGNETIEIEGYSILTASAGRKQVFTAVTDTYLTMLFKTEAKTYTKAEDEFTDEAHLLMSRHANAINMEE